jgi:hypothetical protein
VAVGDEPDGASGAHTIAPVSTRTPGQLALRRRIEALIGVAAPVLDVLLYAGDRVARVAGRNDIDPEPPRRIGTPDGRPAPERLRAGGSF